MLDVMLIANAAPLATVTDVQARTEQQLTDG
jgi:hypothetical protein